MEISLATFLLFVHKKTGFAQKDSKNIIFSEKTTAKQYQKQQGTQ